MNQQLLRIGDLVAVCARGTYDTKKAEIIKLRVDSWGRFPAKNRPDHCIIKYDGRDDEVTVSARDIVSLWSTYETENAGKLRMQTWRKQENKKLEDTRKWVQANLSKLSEDAKVTAVGNDLVYLKFSTTEDLLEFIDKVAKSFKLKLDPKPENLEPLTFDEWEQKFMDAFPGSQLVEG